MKEDGDCSTGQVAATCTASLSTVTTCHALQKQNKQTNKKNPTKNPITTETAFPSAPDPPPLPSQEMKKEKENQIKPNQNKAIERPSSQNNNNNNNNNKSKQYTNTHEQPVMLTDCRWHLLTCVSPYKKQNKTKQNKTKQKKNKKNCSWLFHTTHSDARHPPPPFPKAVNKQKIMILFLQRFSMLNMLNCAEQYKCKNNNEQNTHTHTNKTIRTTQMHHEH